MDTLITLKQIHRLHQNKIHKLIQLNNKDKGWLWADLTLKRQIEYLKDTFYIAYRNGYKKEYATYTSILLSFDLGLQ